MLVLLVNHGQPPATPLALHGQTEGEHVGQHAGEFCFHCIAVVVIASYSVLARCLMAAAPIALCALAPHHL